MVSWSLVWQLRFNADKCKVLHVGPNNPEHQYSMESRGTRSVLLSTELEKDLGVNMDPSLKFSKHRDSSEQGKSYSRFNKEILRIFGWRIIEKIIHGTG